MILWKMQKKKSNKLRVFSYQYIFLFVLGLFFISCSDESQYSGQEIFVDISPRITTYYADTDLTSHYPFPRFTFLESNILLVNNMIRNSLDTLFFDGDTLRIKEGAYYKRDGPRQIENYNNLIYTSQGLIYFHAKNIMIDKDGVSDIENHRLINSDIFGEDAFYGLAGGVSFLLDQIYRGYDKQRDRLYFFADNFLTGEFKMVAFNLREKEFIELPMWANVDLVNANKVNYKTYSKNNMPFIFIYDDRLILSYNYSSEFSIVDLVSEKAINKDFSSNLFPPKKQPPLEITADYDLKDRESLKKVMELMGEWDIDVAFGNFEKLPNGKGFCRMVKSPQKYANSFAHLSLEVFDNDFEKIGEVKLTELEPDLSAFYFSVEDKLFFKAKNQENENYIDYYFVQIDF